jgi:RIO kinase 2
MSSAEMAVHVFKELETEDFRILNVIEAGMSKHEFVPKEQIQRYAKVPMDRIDFILGKLNKLGLTYRTKETYNGHTLNYVGYDCLAINALVKAGIIVSFGQSLGVGKEADVFDALNPECKRIAIKFHRLGRISFRQTRRKRGYTREHSTWLFQSHLAAEREFQSMKLAYDNGVSVPEPISQNRHVVAMGMIEGAQLAKYKDIGKPQNVFREILRNLRRAYLKAQLIHADISEYNLILQPDGHILIIDWPQAVKTDHINAMELLDRDIKNVLTYFSRKFNLNVPTETACKYVTGEARGLVV